MEHQAVAELSLGPSLNAYSRSDGSFCKKRNKDSSLQTCVELHRKDPLPPEWEQCLDLHSGRMYYLNRRTLKKSLEWPMENGSIDLELNIFTSSRPQVEMRRRRLSSSSAGSTGNNIMVAVPCHKCHLLVMLCTSSPVCPNCSFVNTLLPQPIKTSTAAPPRLAGMRSLQTLNLLN